MIQIEDLGNALHTALRKCCDSHPTTIAWNAIEAMPNSSWEIYLEGLLPLLEAAPKPMTAPQIGEIVSRYSKSDRWPWYKDRNRLMIILYQSFTLFDEDDWIGYISLADCDPCTRATC